jgi:hypothetical protein
MLERGWRLRLSHDKFDFLPSAIDFGGGALAHRPRLVHSIHNDKEPCPTHTRAPESGDGYCPFFGDIVNILETPF